MNFQDAIASAQQKEHGEVSWDIFSTSFEDSLQRLEELIDDISDLKQVCKDEWCEAAECLLGEATVAAFTISEPHWAAEEDSKKLRSLKKKIHDLHSSNRKPILH